MTVHSVSRSPRGALAETINAAPVWLVIATAAVIALGFAGRRQEPRSFPDGSRAPGDRPPSDGIATSTADARDEPSPARAHREPSGDEGRGRQATTPSEIPARGWKDILLRVYNDIEEHRILVIAAGVTYYSLLAIFPAIAALVSLYGLFADPARIAAHVDSLTGLFPSGALDVIRDQLNRVAAQGRTKLGFAFGVSLVVSLWSANAGVKSLFDALNLVYGEREKRSFIRLNLISLGFTTAALVLVLIALAAIVAVPAAIAAIHIPPEIALFMRIVRWPILLVVIALILSLVYRHGPSRSDAKWRWITWGSAFAAVAWVVVSVLFSWYAANFGSYNETYGSLGAIIGFMVWLWLSTIVVLLGAQIDAEMEHQTARDTTTGHPKPMGSRGAVVADTVAPAQD